MMDVLIDKHNAITGSIIAVLSYRFGPGWPLFVIFFAFNVADFVTGWMKSRMAKKENSVKGLNGILKKFGYWLMIFISFLVGYFFIIIGDVMGVDLHITTIFGWIVLAELIVNELRSVLENFVECGYDIPKILVDGMEVANHALNETDWIDGGKSDDGNDKHGET